MKVLTGIHQNFRFGTDEIIGWAVRLTHPDLKEWLEKLSKAHKAAPKKLYGENKNEAYFPLAKDAMYVNCILNMTLLLFTA